MLLELFGMGAAGDWFVAGADTGGGGEGLFPWMTMQRGVFDEVEDVVNALTS